MSAARSWDGDHSGSSELRRRGLAVEDRAAFEPSSASRMIPRQVTHVAVPPRDATWR